MKVRHLIVLTMFIVGIVLIVSGVFAITYHYVEYEDRIDGMPVSLPIQVGVVYPYTSMGLVLDILGVIVLIIGALLLLTKPEK